ncbi:hypothetical protein L484_010915 [Morus notabilis]|uniref:Uncharacterized protein n=1 Tax=Morus notabilis TaxID=981085 RepID=W9RIM4_9ROSA|nr:hypothetical protein L484_010912 [Morus notabilis]EXB93776.1 hypothetical protein L484_010915 [Morus notabilis]
MAVSKGFDFLSMILTATVERLERDWDSYTFAKLFEPKNQPNRYLPRMVVAVVGDGGGGGGGGTPSRSI